MGFGNKVWPEKNQDKRQWWGYYKAPQKKATKKAPIKKAPVKKVAKFNIIYTIVQT